MSFNSKTESSAPGFGTLLIAEDEVDIRDLLVELLAPVAAEILVARDGKEALQLVRSLRIDAVLSDIKMPIMTGLQFLAEVRGSFDQTPVIILTGQGDSATIQEALRLDATDFVEKPCDNKILIESVRKAIAYGSAMRDFEAELDQLYAQSALPADQIVRMKRTKRTVMGMKVGFSSYIKRTA